MISITLKNIDAGNFEASRLMITRVINEEARRFQFLLDSDRLSKQDKRDFELLFDREMADDTLFSSLKLLSELLQKHYGHKVIILVDEYDVPLAKANQSGYYKNMVDVIRNIFHACLNTLHSFTFEGSAGFEKMQNIMAKFHEGMDAIGPKKVLTVLDYSKGLNGLPKSDVLKYLLDDNCSVTVRPSGTEPKLKTYISVSARDKETAKEIERKVVEALKVY